MDLSTMGTNFNGSTASLRAWQLSSGAPSLKRSISPLSTEPVARNRFDMRWCCSGDGLASHCRRHSCAQRRASVASACTMPHNRQGIQLTKFSFNSSTDLVCSRAEDHSERIVVCCSLLSCSSICRSSSTSDAPASSSKSCCSRPQTSSGARFPFMGQ